MPNIVNLVLPNNLTEGLQPAEIKCASYKDGLEKALAVLNETCGSNPALFVFEQVFHFKCVNCYNEYGDTKGIMKSFWRNVQETYQKCGRKNAIVKHLVMQIFDENKNYLENLNKQIRNWADDPNGKDMYTKENQIHGLSSEIVVVFQEDDPKVMEINICMRAKMFLIVVYVPSKVFDCACICGKPKEPQQCEICSDTIDEGSIICKKLECIEKKAVECKDLGNALFKEKDYKGAINAYFNGYQCRSTNTLLNTQLLTNRAAAHFHLKEYDKSLLACKLAVEKKPDHLKAITRIVLCYHQMNNIKEAIEWAEKALKQDDSDQKLIDLLAIMKNKGS